jgi:hypothetical protein
MSSGQALKRSFPRRKISLPCWVSRLEQQVLGKTLDISYRGVAIVLPEAIELTEDEARLQIPEGIWLWGRSIYLREENDGYRVGYKIERIERGDEPWQQLCYVPRW